MKCPLCDNPMVHGTVDAKGGVATQVLQAGIHEMATLEFTSHETGECISIVGGEDHPALCCPACGTVLIPGEGMTKFYGSEIARADFDYCECLECHATIRRGRARVPRVDGRTSERIDPARHGGYAGGKPCV
jgi:hypothetical protein